MRNTTIHLICNAHLDPVWLWEWQEGAAEAISTFRIAADFCEKYAGFVFNHNEAVLYKWVQEYEPALFARIQKLVKSKKWHIMGGWYLQPDCNLPSGESFVRQILLGRAYFKKHFGAEPKAAINFDSFGHTRGLVQIISKSGFDSYLFGRPDRKWLELPDNDFIWVGYDGSEILATRFEDNYLSRLGQAGVKAEKWISGHPGRNPGIVLWGVGNHGGGPSKRDVEELTRLIRKNKDIKIIHSTPEAYFKQLKKNKARLPRWDKDINPWAVGCYTTMARVKQGHRLLENEIYALEKMASAAACQGLMKYPRTEIDNALCDLMMSQFHDILPGSCTQASEASSLRVIEHGLEIVSRLKTRAFFALAAGQPQPAKNETPILVYNPHPFRMETIVECECQLADKNWNGTFAVPGVFQNGRQLSSQPEKEDSNLNCDWRKKVVFNAVLQPGRMNRFNVRWELWPSKPGPELKEKNGRIIFKTGELKVIINAQTGLIDGYCVNGVDYLAPRAFQPLVVEDDEDSWGMKIRRFDKVIGRFKLMTRKGGTEFSGITNGNIRSVRVIEDGHVRSVVEAVFAYGNSFICQRYKLPKRGTEIAVEMRVFWQEKNRMLKLSVPVLSKGNRYVGQTAYGTDELDANGDEAIAQKWVAAVSDQSDRALTCINDGVYGCSFSENRLNISLLRSPAYSTEKNALRRDGFTPRIDQGERFFRFWFNAGKVGQRLASLDREALIKNEKPFALSFFPNGGGRKPRPFVLLSDDIVQITAIKQAEKGRDLIVRLYEPTGKRRTTILSLPFIPMRIKLLLSAFEVKTLKIDLANHTCSEVNLLEKKRI